jgi:anaerobic ribonucleoside-triphosphate reductase
MNIQSKKLIEDYLNQTTWVIKENSNNGYSYPSLRSYIVNEVMKEYAMSELYTEEIIEAHNKGFFHIHDLGHPLAPYCCGYSLRDLLQEGFSGIEGRSNSNPPTSLRVACHQMANFLGVLQSEASGAQAFNCYSEDTEVLTDKGWKLFSGLSIEDKVMTFNTITGASEFQTPIKYYKSYYEGDMYHFKSNCRDLLVTPNHRMLIEQRKGKRYILKEAKDITYGADGYCRNSIPHHSKWLSSSPARYRISETQDFDIYDFVAFLGLFLSEGSLNAYAESHNRYIISISQVKEFNKLDIEALLTRLGVKWCYNGCNFRFSNKELYLYLKQFGTSYDRFIPRDILNMSIDVLDVLRHWLIMGDGYKTKEGYERYFTTSKRLKDDVMELYVKLGHKVSSWIHNEEGNISVIRDREAIARQDCWGICAYSAIRGRLVKPLIEQYKGLIYCVQVPNGTLMVRRGGKSEWCGNSVSTFLAPYIRKDNLDYKEVYQCMQELVYNLNIPTRSGEIPFTNFSFDWNCPKDLTNQNPYIGGEVLDFTYGDLQIEIDMINKAFIEVMLKGDKDGRSFGFPIPTYNVTKDFNWDSELTHLLFTLVAKYGTPYFQNFVTSDLEPSDIRSLCCRLSLRLDELRRRGGIFNAWDGTGSLNVITLNLPRLAFIAGYKEKFLELIKQYIDIAVEAHIIKRDKLNILFKNNLFPYLKRWLPKGFVNHFNTIGIVGFNEALRNMGVSIESEKGKDLILETMEFIIEELKRHQERTGLLFNLEETPAEGVCARFAHIDLKELEYCAYSGTLDSPYYTQGAKLPFNHTDNIFKVLDHQHDISAKYTGGSVQHIFLGEDIGADMASKLIKAVIYNYKTPYITLSPTYSICKEHGHMSGRHDNCTDCGKPCEVYSRIVGYYSPTYRWNESKKEEFNDRKTFEQVKHNL